MININSLLENLRTVKQFQTLSDDNLQEIISSGQIRNLEAGKIIFMQDEPCAGMFVLIQGRVNLCKLGPQGQQNILATINPVIMFNEVPVLDHGPNPLTAIATQKSLVWQIQCDAFQNLLKRFPEIGLSLLRVLATRNRRLIEHYEDLSYRSVDSRVAKLLLDLSDNGSKVITRREHSIEEMASLIASVAPVISRTINLFKLQGIISTSRTTIDILKPKELAGIARIDFNFLD
jgi:CRP/FNR family transcriptional regulator